jgi:hypothetical protein
MSLRILTSTLNLPFSKNIIWYSYLIDVIYHIVLIKINYLSPKLLYSIVLIKINYLFQNYYIV